MKTSHLLNKNNVCKPAKNTIDHLLWELCKSVLYNPVKCNVWSYKFCTSCYEKFEQEVGSCPKMCINPTVEKADSKLLKELEEIEFKCPNRFSGCKEIQKYKDVITHEQICKFALAHCVGQPLCDQKLLKRDIDKHEKLCKYIHVECKFCGETKLLRGQLQAHYEQWAQTKKCPTCDIYIQKEERYWNELLIKWWLVDEINFT